MNRPFNSRFTAAVATLTLMGVVIVGGPTPAGATTLTWSTTPSPFDFFNAAYPPGGAVFHEYPTGALHAVSCTSARFCMSLGTTGPGDDLASAPTVTEAWDGARWFVAPRARVVGGTFTAISCVSRRMCVAVGYTSGSSSSPLVQSWDGSDWSVTTLTNGPGPINELHAVSCASKMSCVAVGFASDGVTRRPLVESWNGTDWSVVATPSLSATSSSLTSVSCSSHAFCIAIGSQVDASANFRPLVERWNGTAWTVPSNPDPGAASALNGVSCASSHFCVAVGFVGVSTLAETWDGTTWTTLASPLGSSSVRASFAAVSCPKTSNCVAAQQMSGPTAGSVFAVVSQFDGTAWAGGTGTASTSGGLAAVSCANASFCFAVGGDSYFSIGSVALLGRP